MKQSATILLSLIVLILTVTTVLAQSGSGYAITKWNTSAGGGHSTSGPYTFGGTAGQPATGEIRGGDYTLNSGFWGSAGVQHTVYLPLIIRQG